MLLDLRPGCGVKQCFKDPTLPLHAHQQKKCKEKTGKKRQQLKNKQKEKIKLIEKVKLIGKNSNKTQCLVNKRTNKTI